VRLRSPDAIESTRHRHRRAKWLPIRFGARLPHGVRLVAIQTPLLEHRRLANAIQAATAAPHGLVGRSPWSHGFVGSSLYFGRRLPPSMSRWCPGGPDAGFARQKVPRRAMIRRRGKRGRIWRAEAPEAYENHTRRRTMHRDSSSWSVGRRAQEGLPTSGCALSEGQRERLNNCFFLWDR